jgi:alpha-glucosidase (family GH31 glycosyl hydrolase)
MVDQLHDLGFKVTLWVTPFAEESSKAYHEGRVKGYWVKDGADPSKPAPSKWWNVRDTTRLSAMSNSYLHRELVTFWT